MLDSSRKRSMVNGPTIWRQNFKETTMIVPFEKLSPESRIWIYQSDKKLTTEEKEIIESNTNLFLEAWTAHGNSLEAAMTIMYDQFIVIGVNEAVNEASGCSIDKSVNYMRELGNRLNINLLERSKVAIRDNATINLIDFSDIKKAIAEGLISENSEVFNNAIASKKEIDTSWIIPASESWIRRYF